MARHSFTLWEQWLTELALWLMANHLWRFLPCLGWRRSPDGQLMETEDGRFPANCWIRRVGQGEVLAIRILGADAAGFEFEASKCHLRHEPKP